MRGSSPGVFHQAFLVPLPLAVLYRGALVMLLLALGQRDFELRPASFPVQGNWDNGIALALHAADQVADFSPVKQ